jgi:multidrug resistance protein
VSARLHREGADDTLPAAVRRSPLAVIFLTVFIDLLGFGIVIPILPTYAERFGASATVIGLLGATYSFMQVLFAPVWGRVSDRVGRRPIIVITALGAAVSYTAFGLADNLAWLFVARAIAGICGANIATAQAYVADVTTPENRAKGMGMIGAALGLGFTLGPMLGGLATSWGGTHTPFFVAAGLATVNAIWAAIALPEPARHVQVGRRGLGTLADALKIPSLAFWILLYLLLTFAFANIENAFVLFNAHEFGFTERDNGLVFGFIGVILVLMQGGAVRPLTAKFGSERLVIAGAAICGLGAALLPLADTGWKIFPPTFLIAAGNALFSPSLSATISLNAPPDRQGEMLGVSQSAGAVGRIAGPTAAGLLFDHASHGAPFIVAGALLLLAAVATAGRRARQAASPAG